MTSLSTGVRRGTRIDGAEGRLVKPVQFLPPPAWTGRVARPRLEGIADRIVDVPVTLLVAGGGFGKSTLLSAWFAALESRTRRASLVLDEHDGSSSAFAELLWQSLRSAVDGLGDSVSPLLEDGVADARSIARAMTLELLAWTEDHDEDVVIFVDDVHHLTEDPSGSLALLSAFIIGMSPRVHVVLSSRHALSFAPLTRLRSEGRLVEVGETDLRFSAEEAERLIGNPELARSLVERTEGWAISISLAARTADLQHVAAEAAFPIARDASFAFFAEEVMASLSAPVRQQLYALALPVIIDEPTAGYLLDSFEAAGVLENIAARGLYLTRIGPQRWRFHQLFREFLLQRFRAEAPQPYRALRQRYATLLRQRGDKLQALAQLIEAGDYLGIVESVQEAIVTIRFTDRYHQVLDLLSQVPDSVKRQKPMLYRLQARALQRVGLFDEAERHLQMCKAQALATGDEATACVALIELGIGAGNFRFQGHGDFAKSEQFFREAVALAEGERLRANAGYRRYAHCFLGLALAARFAYEEAFTHLSIAERQEREAERHWDPSMVWIAHTYGWMGEWDRALEYAETAEEYCARGDDLQIGHALLMQARAHFAKRSEPARAFSLAERAVEAFHKNRQHDELGPAYVLLARCALVLDPPNVDAANEACELASRYVNPLDPSAGFDLKLALAEAALATNRLDAATKALDTARDIARRSKDEWRSAIAVLTRGNIDCARGHCVDGGALFAQAEAAFAKLSDRHNASIATLCRLGAEAAEETLAPDEVKTYFSDVDSGRLANAPGAAARASQTLFLWCLRSDVEVGDAEAHFSGLAREIAADVAAIAQDRTISSPGRACAVRTLAKVARVEHAGLIARLVADDDPVVASTAAAVRSLLPASSVPRVSLSVVGRVAAHFDAAAGVASEATIIGKKPAELLRYLALQGGPASKHVVIKDLWPEGGPGVETTLRVTLHTLRRSLQPDQAGGGDYVVGDATTLAVNRENVGEIDAERALAGLRQARYLIAKEDYSAAGALLHDCIATLEAAPPEGTGPSWLQPHLVRWRSANIEALTALATVQRSQGERGEALRTARRALALDPLDEDTVCLLLELYAERGDYDRGKVTFAEFKQRLAEAGAGSPGPGTVELYSKVLAIRPAPATTILSEREIEVLRLIAQGRSNKEIASVLNLSPWTVNNHVARILKKLDVPSRAAAVTVSRSVLDV